MIRALVICAGFTFAVVGWSMMPEATPLGARILVAIGNMAMGAAIWWDA